MTEASDALRTVAPALAFLLVGVPLAALLDRLGFFEATAAHLQHRRPELPIAWLWVLAAATTVLLNLDTTVVLLTPLYVRLARRSGSDPLEVALIPLLLAAFASSVLPISNLTTLIAAEQLDLSVGDVVRHLALPSLAATVVGWFAYRRHHPAVLPAPAAAIDPPDLRPIRVGAPIVAAVLVGVVVGPSFGIDPWVIVLVADLILVVITRSLPWRTLPVGTAVAVGAMAALVGAAVSPHALDAVRDLSGVVPFAGVVVLASLVADTVNNIPATLVMVDGATATTPAVWAWLLGVNVGSVLVPIGALANLLWLRIVRVEGIDVDLGRYVRLVWTIAVPALVAAIVAQALQSLLT